MIEVHSLWIGESFPEWLPHCVASWVDAGHKMHWWIYPQERERDFQLLRCSEVGHRLFASPLLNLRDANDLMPLDMARAQMFYHGLSKGRKRSRYSGWAPFSDWFRYELLGRLPTSSTAVGWVDADSFCLRNLREILEADHCPLVLGSERHRRDRRTLGAVVLKSNCAERWSAAPVKLQEFHRWSKAQPDLCLVTNNLLLRRSSVGSVVEPTREMFRRMAEEMRSALRSGQRGIRGTHGMTLLQRAVRQAGPRRVRILHWSVFNPVQATEASRLHRCLQGHDVALPRKAVALHIFRQVRDEWIKLGLPMPKMKPRRPSPSPGELVAMAPPPPKSGGLLEMLNASRFQSEIVSTRQAHEVVVAESSCRRNAKRRRQLDN
eukprot:s2138_g8.t1